LLAGVLGVRGAATNRRSKRVDASAPHSRCLNHDVGRRLGGGGGGDRLGLVVAQLRHVLQVLLLLLLRLRLGHVRLVRRVLFVDTHSNS
jgi:hypothetical protein